MVFGTHIRHPGCVLVCHSEAFLDEEARGFRADVRNDRFKSRHHRRLQRGVAAVEFAVVAAVLVLILMVAADYGRVFAVSIAVTNAARAGAQYGIQNTGTWGNPAGMQTAALNDAAGISGISASASNFCECTSGTAVSCTTPGCSSPRRYVSVTATATFTPLTAYPGLPDSIALTRTAVMRAP